MPGPVSDSYDPEFGTAENASAVRAELTEMYNQVTVALEGQPPLPILELIQMGEKLTDEITVQFSEYELRLIRFALERAIDSV